MNNAKESIDPEYTAYLKELKAKQNIPKDCKACKALQISLIFGLAFFITCRTEVIKYEITRKKYLFRHFILGSSLYMYGWYRLNGLVYKG